MSARLVVLLAVAVDAVATWVLWPRLPAQVPVHWGLSGEPDRFGDRLELALTGPGLLLALGALRWLVRRVDPRASTPLAADAPPAEAGTRDAVLVVGLMALGHVGMLLLASASSAGPALLGLVACAFQLLAGNLLPRVRPNFFVGVRTPWTLSSDRVWRRTHRLAGRLLFGSGLLSALALAVAPEGWRATVVVGLLTSALLAPAAASYGFWRAEGRARGSEGS
jgi:uncharacterized membrane protein